MLPIIRWAFPVAKREKLNKKRPRPEKKNPKKRNRMTKMKVNWRKLIKIQNNLYANENKKTKLTFSVKSHYKAFELKKNIPRMFRTITEWEKKIKAFRTFSLPFWQLSKIAHYKVDDFDHFFCLDIVQNIRDTMTHTTRAVYGKNSKGDGFIKNIFQKYCISISPHNATISPRI